MLSVSTMKTAILLVAYGASSAQGRSALTTFDAMVRHRFPSASIRWAYTSLRIRERLADDRCKSDSVHKAMRRLCLERFAAVAVQPLQTIAGQEYGQVCTAVEDIASDARIAWGIGQPLLAGEADIGHAAHAALAHFPSMRTAGEDVVFMGHGTGGHPAVARYAELDGAVRSLDPNAHVGTMAGTIGLPEILTRLTSDRVWLLPLLSVVGRHALEDMAGGEENSWNSRIRQTGRTCVPVLRGMAESSGFAEIWLRHLAAVMQTL
jgi:sirohydrochlorin cobaltochelatase